jgi:hypothetical protein
MRTSPTFLMLVVSLLLAPTAHGEGLDATTELRCALAEAAECDEAANCSDVTVADIDLPELVHVDFAAKVLASPDRQRTSPIGAVEVLDAVLVLQGHQDGRGWTMVVERATGHLSATVAGAEGVFVIAGGCAAR